MYIKSKTLAIALGIGSTLMAVSAADNTTIFDESMLSSLPGMGSELPVLGSNIDGGSVFANYVKARNDGQFFLLFQSIVLYEKPLSSKINWSQLNWCSNLEFTDIGSSANDTTVNGIGYTARCVTAFIGDTLSNADNAGAQQPHSITADEFVATASLSAVYIPQTNVFEGQYHKTTDNFVIRFWDDGRSIMSYIVWEVHDEGDTHPNAATSSLSGAGKISWIHIDEAASLLNNNADDFTHEKFTDIYAEVWCTDPYHVETIDDGCAVSSGSTVDGELADEAEEDEPAPVVDGTEDEDDGSDGEEADDGTDDSSGTTRRLSVVIPSIFSTILGYF